MCCVSIEYCKIGTKNIAIMHAILHSKTAIHVAMPKQAAKVIWRKATTLPHMNSSVEFARLRQCAPHLIHASLGLTESTSQIESRLVLPFCRAHGRVPILYIGLPLCTGDLDLHIIHGYLGPTESTTQMASWSLQMFLQSSRLWQTDWQIDHTTPGCIYVVSWCGLNVSQ